MRKFSVFLLVLPLLFFTSGMAGALTLQSVEGQWHDVVGGGATVNFNPVVQPDNDVEVHWGVGVGGSGLQSGLGFLGVIDLGDTPVPVNPGDTFMVGTLTHFNNEIYLSSAASSADLSIYLDFVSAPDGLFTFTFEIDETPGTGTPDTITFPSSFPPESIDSLTLQLLGFGPNAGSIEEFFQSDEGGENSTFLWAKLTETPGVPEPATLILVGSGLLGLAGIGRKKLLKK